MDGDVEVALQGLNDFLESGIGKSQLSGFPGRGVGFFNKFVFEEIKCRVAGNGVQVGIEWLGRVDGAAIDPELHEYVFRQFLGVEVRLDVPENELFDPVEVSNKYFLEGFVIAFP